MDGYEGSMRDWHGFGQWMEQLKAGRDNLSDDDLAELLAITRPLATTEEKRRAVYDYLQSKTRYVSIRLGIGGWQPFETTFVHEKNYGDCKALTLTFYTQSLLKRIGIKSYYTLIEAGTWADEP